MLCPVCQKPQVIVEFEGVEVDACQDGHGLWLDAQELGQLMRLAGRHEDVEALLEQLGESAPAPMGPGRRCPRCRGRLRPVLAPGAGARVMLDRCPFGHGLWLDDGELETFLGMSTLPSAGPRVLREFLGAYAQDTQRSSGASPKLENPS